MRAQPTNKQLLEMFFERFPNMAMPLPVNDPKDVNSTHTHEDEEAPCSDHPEHHLEMAPVINNYPAVIKAAHAVVDRWDAPLYMDLPPTAVYIHALRDALQKMEVM